MVSAFDAITAALRRLGVDRITLATPYPQALTETEAAAFTGHGITVTAHASLGDDDRYADITATQVRTLVEGMNPAALGDADALVLSCTGWPTLGVIPELEARLGIPVLSSNLAMAAYAAALTDRRSTPR